MKQDGSLVIMGADLSGHTDGAMPEQPFQPDRREPCFCGSGLRFKHCCGSYSAARKPPHGVRVIRDFLSLEQCEELVNIASARPATWLKVVDPEHSSAQKTVFMNDPRRITERVDMTTAQTTLNHLVKTALSNYIVPEYADDAVWFEPPHILKYSPGGYYHSHADSHYMDPKTGTWTKILDRDVSLLIYLNDAYSGGALRFDHFHYTLQPSAGMLVFFPSDHRYLHTALPVTSGVRYALVSWAALQGQNKVCAQPPAGAIRFG